MEISGIHGLLARPGELAVEERKAVDVSSWTSAQPWAHLPRHLLEEPQPRLGQGHSSVG